MKAYRFKITLKYSHPPIWRRIDIPASTSFTVFSEIINELFGFSGYHMASFDIPGTDITIEAENNSYSFGQVLLMCRHCLEEFEDCPKLGYTYDFGDNWDFVIKREVILPNYQKNTPTLVKYKGDNLVEDIGGIYGYYDWLEKAKEGTSDEDDEMSWGKPEDYAFNPDSVQSRLDRFVIEDPFVIPKNAPEEDVYYDDDDDDDYGMNKIEQAFQYLSVLEKLQDPEYVPESAEETAVMSTVAFVAGLYEAVSTLSEKLNIPIDELMEKLDLDEEDRMLAEMLLSDTDE